MTAPGFRRRLLAPEVVQTSGMDCGPAALKSLLEGFGIPVSYGRLREACHTGIDGTSIGTIEEVARAVGLDAQQIMVPADHVLLPQARTWPAVAVVRNASGATHFVLAWRTHGPLVQVMDPARGRLWLSASRFLQQLVVHSTLVPAVAWREFAATDDFVAPLKVRLDRLGIGRADASGYVERALGDPSWRSLAKLDAAVRMITTLRSTGAFSRSRSAPAIDALLASHDPAAIPPQYWFARSQRDDDESLILSGAVLVAVRSRSAAALGNASERRAETLGLSAALTERPVRPLRDLAGKLDVGARLAVTQTVLASLLAVAAVVFEATVLRSMLDIGGLLRGPEQGWVAGAALATFALAMLALEGVLSSSERRLGRRLEHRLRVSLLEKLPQLSDAYFHSRPVSDMLERSHALHTLRVLPRMGVRLTRVGFELVLTALALAWLNPSMAGLAIAAAFAAATIPLLGHALLAERDLRARTHAGALARFHLEALLGRTAIEVHGAGAALEREHEALLSEWAGAAQAAQRTSIVVEGSQMAVGFGLTAWMLFATTGSGAGGLLLQLYWMLNLPALGYELALIAREYPAHRTTIIRLLEPLAAPSSQRDATHTAAPPADAHAVHVSAAGVSVVVGGQRVLDGIDLQVPAGTHVAVIGASGAGKSTLTGLLLGWHVPASGELHVDGAPLTPERLDALRRETAWVDPTVHIWNQPLLDNLLYGSDRTDRISAALDKAGLLPVVAKLPQGLATPLGEGGALLSAGEAQRVRLGRAMVRDGVRLVVLDEPFVGLERDRRRALLTQSRQHWHDTTLFYVTHDVAETRAFDRVVVLERGRIVEDGNPIRLAQLPASRYRRMLLAQETAHSRFAAAEWRRLRLDEGRLVQDHVNASEQRA